MKETLIDRLHNRVEQCGHVCVGLDTDPDYLPEGMSAEYPTPAEAVFAFNRAIVDKTLDIAAVYKVQIAYYEAMGLEGLRTYAKTLAYLREHDAITIADVKRGDIAKTAEMYARSHFSGDFEADFMTWNPLMGMDTLEPFLPFVENHNKGIFALVATSNPGASHIEGLVCSNGESVSEKIGSMVGEIAARYSGKCGYSPIGAVVGCTNRGQTIRIRERLPGMFFLIPGYGAQGGKAEDMKDYMKDKNGGIVNSSRGILLAYKKADFAHLAFDEAARAETLRMRDDIKGAL